MSILLATHAFPLGLYVYIDHVITLFKIMPFALPYSTQRGIPHVAVNVLKNETKREK